MDVGMTPRELVEDLVGLGAREVVWNARDARGRPVYVSGHLLRLVDAVTREERGVRLVLAVPSRSWRWVGPKAADGLTALGQLLEGEQAAAA